MNRSLIRKICLVVLAVAVAGGTFLYGFLAAEHSLFPSAVVARYEEKVRKAPHILQGRPPQDSILTTELLRFNVRSIHVPTDPGINNGSLTSVGKDMLVLSGAGDIFYYKAGTDAVVASGLKVPSNHRDELRTTLAGPKYQGTLQDFYITPRYQHLFHVAVDGQQLLFLTFTEWHQEGQCYTSTLARLDVTAQGNNASGWSASPADWTVIFRSNPCLPLKEKMRPIEAHISGGRMVYDPSTHELILTLGDYHWDGVFNDTALAQDDSNDYGKILAMGLDGKAVRHVAKGLRNPQGITRDDVGRIWITEHGPMGGDELNLVRQDANYGWPLATLGKGYNGLPWKQARQYGRHDDFVPPVYSWIPSRGLSSIMQVQGFDSAWDGDFLVSSLSAHTVWRVRVVDEHVLFAEPIAFDEGIRYMMQPEPGVIAMWTDSRHLLLLTHAAVDETLSYVEKTIATLPTEGRREAARNAIEACQQCHSWQPQAGKTAPHLIGVYNRQVASTEFSGYTPALRSVGGRWTEDRLKAFISDPQQVAPGTAMPKLGLPPDTVADVEHILQALNAAD